jgi:hypothetical protein
MTTRLYFDNGQSGTPLFSTMDMVSESSPGAPWSSPVACTLNGVAATNLADPQVNLLANGQYLLTWSTQSEIDTAISSDGINFTSEQLAVAAPPNSSVTDPSVVQLPNGTFLMVVAVNGPSETTETFYSSTDGRNWTATGASIPNIGGGGLAVMADGSIRFYVGAPGVNGQPGGVGDFISFDNGRTWSFEPGLCVVTPSNAGLPSVWQAAPGLYDMVFQTLIDPNGPNVPSNQELSFATSTDGRNFTITQANFLVQASSADGITITPPVVAPGTTVFIGDFTGGADADIVWVTSAGTPIMWVMNGTTVASTATLPTPPPASWHLSEVADFNGDHKSDLLWLNNVNNTPSMWLMNGTSIISGTDLPAPPTSWKIVGTGDFNGDGNADILWLNSDNTPSVWEMNGPNFLAAVAEPAPPLSWTIVGTGDFYGNGHSDILWLNINNTASIWEMNGTSLVNATALPAPPSSWRFVGTADFNGDHKGDIMWQNSNGDVSIWEMNGANFLAAVDIGSPGVAWRLIGAGDFNGDGKSDLLFLNPTTSQVQIWLMNGTQVLSMSAPTTAQASAAASAVQGSATALSSSPVLLAPDGYYGAASTGTPVAAGPSPWSGFQTAALSATSSSALGANGAASDPLALGRGIVA